MQSTAFNIGYAIGSILCGLIVGRIVASHLSGLPLVMVCLVALGTSAYICISFFRSSSEDEPTIQPRKTESASTAKRTKPQRDAELKKPDENDRIAVEIAAVKADIRALRRLEANLPRSFQRPLDRCLDAAESIVETCESEEKGDWGQIRSAMIGTLEQIIYAVGAWKKLENEGQITGLQTRQVVKLLDTAESIFIDNKNALSTRNTVEIATSLRLIDDEAKELSRRLAATIR